MTPMTPMTMEITFSDHTVNFDELPETSRKALATYGLSHYLGNVQASKITSKIRSLVGSDAPREEIAKWRNDNAEQVKAWETEYRNEAYKALTEGTVGVRQAREARQDRVPSTSRLDPVERRLRELIVIEATALVAGLGLKLPKASKDGEPEPTIEFSNGETRTRSQILANLARNKGEELRKQAKREVDAEARLAQQASARAQGAPDPTSLGI